MSRDSQKDASDAELSMVLDTAISFVRKRKRGMINLGFGDESESGLADPDFDLILGTLRYAGRLHLRRRSGDGMIDQGDLGSTRVSSGDRDIDKLLRLGVFSGLRFA